MLLLPRVAGPNLRRIADKHFVSQLRHQLQKPLTVPSRFHTDPRTGRKLLVKLLDRSCLMHQLLIPSLARLAIQPRNLLPTGVKITSNKNHKAPSVPRVSVLNQKLTRCSLEPSLLSNHGSIPEPGSWVILGVRRGFGLSRQGSPSKTYCPNLIPCRGINP